MGQKVEVGALKVYLYYQNCCTSSMQSSCPLASESREKRIGVRGRMAKEANVSCIFFYQF